PSVCESARRRLRGRGRGPRALREIARPKLTFRDFEFAPVRCYPVRSHMARERVIAAMSGGVDSAVAAGLLVEAGYDVVGVTMKMYAPTRPAHAKSCCGSDDFDDARRSVIDRFVADYAGGRTPNPCVTCNNFVKLGTLRAFADRLGARYVATGHY